MTLKRWAALLVLAMVSAACGNGSSQEPAEEPSDAESSETEEAGGELESKSLKVGFSGQPDFTQIMNFKWLEDLKSEHGVETEDVIFEGTTPPFRALVAGEVDMVVGQVPPGVLLIKETGEDLVMIGGDVAASDYMLVSVPEVKTLADLQGKKVGTAGSGAVSDTLTVTALESENIDTSNIEFLQVGGTSARMAALLSGQVHAAAAHLAEGYAAVEQGLNDLYPIAEAIGPYLFHGVWAKRSWVEANPNLVQLVIDEFIDSVRWAAENEDEYLAASDDVVEGLSETARRKAYSVFLEIGLFAVNGGLDQELIDRTIEIEQKVENLPADIPSADEWVYRDFVDDYLERNGEV